VARLRSLLIDDNDTNRFVAEQILRAAQCEVMMATDGETGVRYATAQEFDLILLDVNLPNLNGWSVAKEIRASISAKSKHAPIYMLTGSTHEDYNTEAMKSGVQGIIPKPLRTKQLENILAEINSSPGVAKIDNNAIASMLDINSEIIRELEDVLGHPRIIAMQQKFVNEIVMGLRQLLEFFKDGRVRQASQLAHQLIGSALVFGATKIATKLSIIEQNASTLWQEKIEQILGEVSLLIVFYEKRIELHQNENNSNLQV